MSTAEEKLREAISFDILKGCCGCLEYIKISKKILLERGIKSDWVVRFLKQWNGRKTTG